MHRMNNRGAGLISVVVLLAGIGLLLSSTFGLAASRYRFALDRESMRTAREEVSLCETLLQWTVEEVGTLESLNQLLEHPSCPFVRFYGVFDAGSSETGAVGWVWNETENCLQLDTGAGMLRLVEADGVVWIRFDTPAGKPLLSRRVSWQLSAALPESERGDEAS